MTTSRNVQREMTFNDEVDVQLPDDVHIPSIDTTEAGLEPDEDYSPSHRERGDTMLSIKSCWSRHEWNPGDMTISLEPEFYTAAFVSPLRLHQQRSTGERICGECFFTLGMLAVGFMQCVTVFGMASFLAEKEIGYVDEFKLGTGLFINGGSTLSMQHSKDLCGTFNHIGLHQFAGFNNLTTSDGTIFEGTASTPVFHSYKLPSGSWNFHSIGSDESFIDKQLRMVHDVNWRDTFQYLQRFQVDYGLLLVIMVGWLWYHVLYELRKIVKLCFVLHHFQTEGLTDDYKQTTELDPETGKINILRLNLNALLVGYTSVVMRVVVVIMMLIWGTGLLIASSNKLSLVLNSLAIGIVFELDVIIAYACIDHNTMQRIEDIEPVHVHTLREILHYDYKIDLILSACMFISVIICAMLVRKVQVDAHVHQLHNAAALCLFAGPPPQSFQNLMLDPSNLQQTAPVLAPVPGFCESLLSMTCAPKVTGSTQHGPCLITDQNIFQDHSVLEYPDSSMYENMVTSNGTRRSMADWGPPSSKLISSQTWIEDRHIDLFRQVCAQMYHPEGTVDARVVDPSLGLVMHSAPFYCPRDQLFKAVFGGVDKDFDKWSSSLDLRSKDIVAALDGCRGPAPTSAASALDASSAPAPAPAPFAVQYPAPPKALQPAAAASQLLGVKHHHAGHDKHKRLRVTSRHTRHHDQQQHKGRRHRAAHHDGNRVQHHGHHQEVYQRTIQEPDKI